MIHYATIAMAMLPQAIVLVASLSSPTGHRAATASNGVTLNVFYSFPECNLAYFSEKQ